MFTLFFCPPSKNHIKSSSWLSSFLPHYGPCSVSGPFYLLTFSFFSSALFCPSILHIHRCSLSSFALLPRITLPTLSDHLSLAFRVTLLLLLMALLLLPFSALLGFPSFSICVAVHLLSFSSLLPRNTSPALSDSPFRFFLSCRLRFSANNYPSHSAIFLPPLQFPLYFSLYTPSFLFPLPLSPLCSVPFHRQSFGVLGRFRCAIEGLTSIRDVEINL